MDGGTEGTQAPADEVLEVAGRVSPQHEHYRPRDLPQGPRGRDTGDLVLPGHLSLGLDDVVVPQVLGLSQNSDLGKCYNLTSAHVW